MMTRGATVRDMSDKLKAALKELESSRHECSQLLRERGDSEVEIERIVNKNTQLKSQLAELHTQHMDILDQHHHLRQLVADFQQCRDTHDQALKRISELEEELCKAHNTITTMNSVKVSEQVTNTNTLFNELIGSVSGLQCEEQTVTIDLTGDDTMTNCPVLTTHNKIKKYIKIKKSIKRYKKILKTQNVYKYNVNLRRENVCLNKQLSDCIIKLENSRQMYDVDIQTLQRELLSRESTLKDIFCKYECSQQMLSDRMQEACELVDLVKYSAERYESLTNNLTCSCAATPPPPMLQQAVTPTYTPTFNPELEIVNVPTQSNIFVFSDRLGANFGSLLNNRSSHKIVNYCYHDLHFNEIIHKIQHTKLNEQSTVVLLIGNSLSISKRDIVNGIDTLLKLKLGKLILCALPYSENLSSQENEFISSLNNLMHFLTCRHRDRLLFFDTNNFVRDFVLIREHNFMFLPRRSRHFLASLLVYILHAVIDNLTETRLSDESVLSCISTNTVSESLNF